SQKRIERIFERASKAITAEKKVILKNGNTIEYDSLLIATGGKPAKLPIKGSDARGVQGFYSLDDLSLLEKRTREGIQHAVFVGGVLIGIDLAKMLRSRELPFTFIVREPRYAPHILPEEESRIVENEIRRHGVDLRLSTEIAEITERDHRADAVCLSNGEVI